MVIGWDGMPLATTSSVLSPSSVFVGTSNRVETMAGPVATAIVLKSWVRAYFTSPVALLVMRTSGKLVETWNSSLNEFACERPLNCVPQIWYFPPGIDVVREIELRDRRPPPGLKTLVRGDVDVVKVQHHIAGRQEQWLG